jgi:hypothetical protein
MRIMERKEERDNHRSVSNGDRDIKKEGSHPN